MTQLLVLGLLKEKPQSGYDIQRMLETSDAESWGGVRVGSIYHALNTLEQGGFITVAAVEQTGRRQKSIYQIAEAGAARFDQLLLEALQGAPCAFPTALYAGLNFLDSLPREQAIASLQKQRAALTDAQSNLDCGKAEKTACMGALHPISDLVFAHMRTTLEEQIQLLDRVISLLESLQCRDRK